MTPEEENMPFDRTGPSSFGLPEGYFEQSARAVFNKVEWLEEHKEFPMLLSLQVTKAFSVPAGYFEKDGELLQYPALLAIKKQRPFTVPGGYFEAQELNELSTVLNGKEEVLAFIPKQNGFRVTDTYFEKKEVQLQHLLSKKEQPARVISLFGPKIRLAVAATLITALGLWLYQANTPTPVQEEKDCGTMACLDKLELLKSKSIESLETEELYDLVNSKDLEKKLQNKEAASAKTSHDSLEDELIDELPDEI